MLLVGCGGGSQDSAVDNIDVTTFFSILLNGLRILLVAIRSL